MSGRKKMRNALLQIRELADSALRDDGSTDSASGNESGNGRNNGHNDNNGNDSRNGGDGGAAFIGCSLRSLPSRLIESAAEHARRVNPVNAPALNAAAGMFGGGLPDKLSIAVLTAKYWGPAPRRLTVSFLDTNSTALRNKILLHMNAWAARCGISFVITQGVGTVRISLGGSGYWSYLGTDVQLIPKNQATMNLQSFTLNTPESEYRRVVRHETGHTLGAPHEHMRKALVDRIDRNKAYDYFLRTQGWNRQMVDQQVLTALNENSLMKTPPDQTSIMCYQLPASITRDGRPIVGGPDINATDFAFMASIYPRPGAGIVQSDQPFDGYDDASDDADQPFAMTSTRIEHDWNPADDVDVDDIELPE